MIDFLDSLSPKFTKYLRDGIFELKVEL